MSIVEEHFKLHRAPFPQAADPAAPPDPSPFKVKYM
jgi:hypothetical protein